MRCRYPVTSFDFCMQFLAVKSRRRVLVSRTSSYPLAWLFPPDQHGTRSPASHKLGGCPLLHLIASPFWLRGKTTRLKLWGYY